MNKKIHIITSIIAVIIVAGGAFYGGMVYGKSQNACPTFPAGNFSGAKGTRTAGAGFVTGSIISKDATSITLKLPSNAGSKIIFYSDATDINKQAKGTSADLIIGQNINVNGTTNSDGSVTATAIQLRPAQ